MSPKILFEDNYLLALSKPAEMHSIRHREQDPVCVSDSLSTLIPEGVSPNREDWGLVQRLDFSTSGVILAAKTAEVWQQMHALLISDGTKKTYLALVEGEPQAQEISASIELRRNAKRVYINETKGKPAKTLLDLLSSRGDVSLVRATSRHTLRHQIRIHLSHIAHPLVGDTKYGSDQELKGRGFLLHAETLSFKHPINGEAVEIRDDSVVGNGFADWGLYVSN